MQVQRRSSKSHKGRSGAVSQNGGWRQGSPVRQRRCLYGLPRLGCARVGTREALAVARFGGGFGSDARRRGSMAGARPAGELQLGAVAQAWWTRRRTSSSGSAPIQRSCGRRQHLRRQCCCKLVPPRCPLLLPSSPPPSGPPLVPGLILARSAGNVSGRAGWVTFVASSCA